MSHSDLCFSCSHFLVISNDPNCPPPLTLVTLPFVPISYHRTIFSLFSLSPLFFDPKSASILSLDFPSSDIPSLFSLMIIRSLIGDVALFKSDTHIPWPRLSKYTLLSFPSFFVLLHSYLVTKIGQIFQISCYETRYEMMIVLQINTSFIS